MASTILHSRGARTTAPAAEPVAARTFERPVGAAFTGLAAVIVGAWGALAGYIGPYFAYRPVDAHVWTASWQNGLLHLLPGAVAAAAGLMLLAMGPARRSVRGGAFLLPAILLLAAGAWFVIGPVAWPTFHSGPAFNQVLSPTRNLLNIACSSFAPGLVLVMLGGMALKTGTVPAVPVVDPYTPAEAVEPVPATGRVATREATVADRSGIVERPAEATVANREAGRAPMASADPVATDRPVVGDRPVAGAAPSPADVGPAGQAEVGGAAAERRGFFRRRT